MKTNLLAFSLAVVVAGCANSANAQSVEAAADTRATVSTQVPMKKYFFVMLRKGPHRDQDQATSDRLQSAHMDHIEETARSGKLIMAGPFDDDGDWRGLFIYDVPTIEEAKSLCNADPAVQAGRMICDIHPWWGQPGTALK